MKTDKKAQASLPLSLPPSLPPSLVAWWLGMKGLTGNNGQAEIGLFKAEINAMEDKWLIN